MIITVLVCIIATLAYSPRFAHTLPRPNYFHDESDSYGVVSVHGYPDYRRGVLGVHCDGGDDGYSGGVENGERCGRFRATTQLRLKLYD